jgi:basic membrane lipoprotein Med (substrate-binding protein (PBP1-ABC) superfamily)
VQVQYIEPGDGSDRESALRQRAAKGDDLVIGVGFIFSDDITNLAKQFPKTKFACIDYSKPAGVEKVPDNLVGLRFREHEGSFLVGAIAGSGSGGSRTRVSQGRRSRWSRRPACSTTQCGHGKPGKGARCLCSWCDPPTGACPDG